MRIYTCAPTPPVPRPAWASGSRATTPPGPIRHSAIGRPMRSTNHRRSRGLLRHRSVWQHDRHYSPQGDRPELRNLSRLSKLGGPAHIEGGGADAGHPAGLLPDPAVVLAQGHIPNVMVPSLNAPVRTDGAGEGLGIEADLAGVIADLLARRPQAGAGILLEGQARDPGDAGDQRLPLGVQLTGGVEDLDQSMLLAAMTPPVS